MEIEIAVNEGSVKHASKVFSDVLSAASGKEGPKKMNPKY